MGGMDGKTLGLIPEMHWYPTSNFFFGPTTDVLVSWGEDSESSQYHLGGELGFITAGGTAFTHVYLGVGADRFQATTSLDGLAEIEESGFSYRIFAGLKFRLGANFVVNLEPTWQYSESERREVDAFSVRIGFSGLLLPR